MGGGDEKKVKDEVRNQVRDDEQKGGYKVSRELRKSLDTYYEELRAVSNKFKEELHKAKTDRNLSAFGKEKLVEELKAGFLEKIEDLRNSFEFDLTDRLENIDHAVKPLNHSKERVRNIRQRLAEGDTFMGQESLFTALLGSIDELREDLDKSTFINSVSRLTNEDMGRIFSHAVEKKDTKRLQWLKDAAVLSGRDSKALIKSAESQIETINDAMLTPEQRQLKTTAKELEKQKELFSYSIERAVSSEGEYVDLREEGEEKAE